MASGSPRAYREHAPSLDMPLSRVESIAANLGVAITAQQVGGTKARGQTLPLEIPAYDRAVYGYGTLPAKLICEVKGAISPLIDDSGLGDLVIHACAARTAQVVGENPQIAVEELWSRLLEDNVDHPITTWLPPEARVSEIARLGAVVSVAHFVAANYFNQNPIQQGEQ